MGVLDWMDKMLGMKPGEGCNPDSAQVRYLLRFCTTKDLMKVASEYISVDGKPKVKDKITGLDRKPTRSELETSIIARVPLSVILRILPNLKKELDNIDPYNDKNN